MAGPGRADLKLNGPGRADLKLNGPGRDDSRISCGPGRAVSKLNGPGRAGPTVLNVGPRARSGAHLDVPGLGVFEKNFDFRFWISDFRVCQGIY